MQIKGKPFIATPIHHILLIQLGDIGDVVLTFPAIRALKETFPEANVVVAVREKAKELIEDCIWADEVISIRQNQRNLGETIRYQWNFFSRLRQFRFDLSINLKPGDRSAILSLLSGAKQRISFFDHDGKLWHNRISTHLNLLDYQLGQYVADYYSSLLAAYHITIRHPLPEMIVPDHQMKKAQLLFEQEHIPSDRAMIALQPFSLWQYKEWGIDKYIQLIAQILKEYPMTILITGSPDERERANWIAENFGAGVFNLAGKTSVGMLAAVIKLCRLFIGVDSAGMHIAGAVGTPTISIFGPSAPASWAPRGDIHAVVQKPLSCVPCRQKGCYGTETSRCLYELTVDDVMAVVHTRLKSAG